MSLAWNVCTIENGEPRDVMACIEILTRAQVKQIAADKIVISGIVTIEFADLIILESLGDSDGGDVTEPNT